MTPAVPWLLFAGYVLAGPLLWALVAVAVRAGRARMDKLKRASRRWRDGNGPPAQDAPRVTIVVPVKDEADGIELCVRGLLAQDYPRFSLLVADDRSADGTGAILDALAAEFPGRLRVAHLTRLPAGWLGKPHALHRAVTDAGEDLGEWLWFVDSDTRCGPAALSHMIGLCRDRQPTDRQRTDESTKRRHRRHRRRPSCRRSLPGRLSSASIRATAAPRSAGRHG